MVWHQAMALEIESKEKAKGEDSDHGDQERDHSNEGNIAIQGFHFSANFFDFKLILFSPIYSEQPLM